MRAALEQTFVEAPMFRIRANKLPATEYSSGRDAVTLSSRLFRYADAARQRRYREGRWLRPPSRATPPSSSYKSAEASDISCSSSSDSGEAPLD